MVRVPYLCIAGLQSDLTSACSLEAYGAKVDQLKAELGTAVIEAEIENALSSKTYKIVTFTHVDTSYVPILIPIDPLEP